MNKENTLTLDFLLRALQDGRVKPDMPIGIIVYGQTVVVGACAFEIHTYKDGSQVFVIHTENGYRPCADKPGDTCAEVGLSWE
jgi:hypothetical protein